MNVQYLAFGLICDYILLKYLALGLICDYILLNYFSHKKIDFPSYKNNYIIMDK